MDCVISKMKVHFCLKQNRFFAGYRFSSIFKLSKL